MLRSPISLALRRVFARLLRRWAERLTPQRSELPSGRAEAAQDAAGTTGVSPVIHAVVPRDQPQSSSHEQSFTPSVPKGKRRPGPPAHWVELVRRFAPELLRPARRHPASLAKPAEGTPSPVPPVQPSDVPTPPESSFLPTSGTLPETQPDQSPLGASYSLPEKKQLSGTPHDQISRPFADSGLPTVSPFPRERTAETAAQPPIPRSMQVPLRVPHERSETHGSVTAQGARANSEAQADTAIPETRVNVSAPAPSSARESPGRLVVEPSMPAAPSAGSTPEGTPQLSGLLESLPPQQVASAVPSWPPLSAVPVESPRPASFEVPQAVQPPPPSPERPYDLWPELPQESALTAEDFIAAIREWERLQRIETEQRGGR